MMIYIHYNNHYNDIKDLLLIFYFQLS